MAEDGTSQPVAAGDRLPLPGPTDIVAEADSIRSVAGESWPYRIRVRGLDGEQTYARALAYLESLSLVDDLAGLAVAVPDSLGRLAKEQVALGAEGGVDSGAFGR